MTTGIPQDQLARIQPVVDALLEEIRRLALNLTGGDGPAVDYSPIEGDK